MGDDEKNVETRQCLVSTTELYGVPQVKRKEDRFPEDFRFQLAKQEMEDWRSQFVTSNRGKMGISRNLNNVPVLYGYEE
ncbi:ORF6N domain-containing protein [bacterium]|nr:ORF6N domain-containing protein [bacterium]